MNTPDCERSLPRQLLRGLPAAQAISLSVAGVLWLLGMPAWVALLYSLLIGNGISASIHVLMHLVLRWQLAHPQRAHPRAAEGFPGWGWLAASIVGGVAIGYIVGGALASAITGLDGVWPRHGSWNLWWRIFALSLIPGLAGTVYFYQRGRVEAAEARAARAQQAAAETQLRLLQSQLEPHMMFNTLANLRALIGIDPARAQGMLDHMIAWLRSTLGASRLPWHPLSTEFRHLEDYLALMRIRMGERLTVVVELPPDLAALPVPPLLLQPLVENAIRHGLEPLRGPAHLALSAQRDGGQLLLSVRDNGVGLDRGGTSGGSGFGLQQVRERLSALYGTAAELRLQSLQGGGTEVTVRLPCTAHTESST
ncbi:MAG: histidine kinase [Burkholderiales bacterium]|nr:histidine kinase [Burkholderiales bacterium]